MRALKHISPKVQDYIYSPGDQILVWRVKIVNGRIAEFTGPSTSHHHDERSKIVAIDQASVIKRCSSSQIRPFVEQLSVPDDAIKDRDI